MTAYMVSELSGALLDAAVAKAEGLTFGIDKRDGRCLWMRPEPPGVMHCVPDWQRFEPSTDWSQGGPIIDRERIGFIDLGGSYEALIGAEISHGELLGSEASGQGPTHLVASMRAYVASKFGEMVEVELT